MLGHEQVPGRGRQVQLVVVDLHHVGAAVGDHPGHAGSPRAGLDGDPHQAGVVLGCRGACLHDVESTLLGQQPGVDEVDRRIGDRLEQTLNCRGGQHADVAIGDLASIADFGRADMIVSQLGGEFTEHHQQAHIGLHHLDVLWSQAGGVHGKLGRTPLEHGKHLARDLSGDVDLGFHRGGAQVRRSDDFGVLRQRIVGRDRLSREDVDADAPQAAFVKGGQQSSFVGQATPRAVDHKGPATHAGNSGRAQDPARRLGERHVQ